MKLSWLFAGVFFVVFACDDRQPRRQEFIPISVEAFKVNKPAASTVLTAVGRLERSKEMTLSFRVSGVLTSLTVNEGDTVYSGDYIAKLDDTSVAADAHRSKVEFNLANAVANRDEALFKKRAYHSSKPQ